MQPSREDTSSPVNDDDKETKLASRTQRTSTSGRPGAFSTKSLSDRNKAQRKVVSRGVDLDDIEQPARAERHAKRAARKESFVTNPVPSSYVSRREARRLAANEENSGAMMLDDEEMSEHESTDAPGAIPIPGMFSLSAGQEVELNPQTRNSTVTSRTDGTSIISADETNAEPIVAAHLVEDIEKQNRAKLRQEIYNEAEQAEVVDTKRQRRCFLLLSCCCIVVLAGMGAGLGLGLKQRQARSNNSVCGNSAPLSLGDTISGNVGNADVSRIETCGPTKPDGVVRGRWFSVVGDGTLITASTCGGTNFDSQISVYSGSSCEELTCVAFDDDDPSCCNGGDEACNSKAAAVTIPTITGENYYIFVHGTNVEADATFELTLSSTSNLGTFASEDVDQQCLKATQDLYNSGVRQELEAVIQGMVDNNSNSACRNMPNGSQLCVLDALGGAENNVDTVCESLGGRYIIKYISFDCEYEASQVELNVRFTNYPDCVSFSCRDEWIDSGLRSLAGQLMPLLEGSGGISCTYMDSSWAEGIVE